MSDADPTVALSQLSNSLTTLEQALSPLLSTPFDNLKSGPEGSEGVEPLLQARLEVLTGYVVHDLVWIYCRTAGVDPNTHPVLQELLRLKSYFDKLKNAEEPVVEKARPQLDKAAATRFINAAINSSRPRVPADYTPTAGPSTPQELGEKGTHTRFEEAEGDVERLLESEEDDDDEEEKEEEVAEKERKEKEKEQKKVKSGRPKMDPFAGYDSPSTKPSSKSKKSKPSTPKPSTPSASAPSSGEKRKAVDSPAGSGTPSGKGKKDKKLKMKGGKGGK
ncbi:hypothetical protein BCR35DRAFT_304905 [Leucosporidium creatinivorum]|uniref:Exosome complex protein n=1 Tax=Leucosporidium creatinivorum TaxID=106004 RepID=A0A1Y2F5W8_9BASI|nr:hypothetical protein BCR35DRAFT_304905 [Leucosporidium creatinivorum]